ncbi:MAG: adenylate/guanylate cyclase domain-containing protein [Vulcanimicrobiaceae bacterium]
MGDDRRWASNALVVHMRQELMAPVTAIVGYCEMLRDQAPGRDAEVISDIGRIHASALHLCELSGHLLDAESSAALLAGVDLDTAQSTIRHDLRTPLNAIKGYSEMLIEDAVDPDLVADLEKLLDETNRLLSRLESIIDFTRSGRAGLESAPEIEVATMVAHLETVIRPLSETIRRKALPGRILVVDDNESNRDLLARRLSKEGHHVEIAQDGYKALAMLDQSAYDLVLLDLMMPGLSGIEVLARFKAQPELASIPVIMVSALHEMDTVVRCIEAGADDHLPKPVNPTLLSVRVDASLERKQAHDRERSYLKQIEEEKRTSERLLLNILPAGIVKRMSEGEVQIADRFDDVTILFSDVVGFTGMSSTISAQVLVDGLNRLFSAFDEATKRFGIEKIKTIGDAYMTAAGLPEHRADHAEASVRLARALMEATRGVSRETGHDFNIRIGLHSGPVVAGVIGSHKFAYDVWGDTVNVASRMESHGIPGRIHLSEGTARRLTGCFPLESRGRITIKGKGEVETFLLAEGA